MNASEQAEQACQALEDAKHFGPAEDAHRETERAARRLAEMLRSVAAEIDVARLSNHALSQEIRSVRIERDWLGEALQRERQRLRLRDCAIRPTVGQRLAAWLRRLLP